MDRYIKEKNIYVVNGNEYTEKVALSYLQALCAFSEQEAKDYLQILRGAKATVPEAVA